jgi:hypothetical protein
MFPIFFVAFLLLPHHRWCTKTRLLLHQTPRSLPSRYTLILWKIPLIREPLDKHHTLSGRAVNVQQQLRSYPMNANSHMQSIVANALGSSIEPRVSSRSIIPLPIQAAVVYAEMEAAIEACLPQVQFDVDTDLAEVRSAITALTEGLVGEGVNTLEDYRNGMPTLSATSNVDWVKSTPESVSQHIHAGLQNAKNILSAMPGLLSEAWVSLVLAGLMMLVAAGGVIHPLLVSAMGANGEPGAIGAMVWASIIGAAFALTLGAINLNFMRQRSLRIAPMPKWLLGAAVAIIGARYVASAIGADFLLVQSLPSWAQTLVQLITALGAGVALLVVELGAGRALALAWLRFRQVHGDRALLQQRVADAKEWDNLRLQWDRAHRRSLLASDRSLLIKVGAVLLAAAIDRGLAVHQETLRRFDAHKNQPFAASLLDTLDINWIRQQVVQCETARDELLRLSGLSAQAKTSPSAHYGSEQPTTPISSTVSN